MTVLEAPPQPTRVRLWRDLRAAVTGSEQDYTTGSIPRAVLLLAVPMVLEMVMESTFALVDVFFVARLGAEAVAIVGITEAMLTLVFAVAIGLSAAATAMVARRIGEKDPEAASVAAVQALAIGLAASLATGLVGVFGAQHFLAAMGASPVSIEMGGGYTAIILGGSFTVYFLFLINAIFRGAGDATLAMRALWLANLINIVLDPCLIFGLGPFPELGVTGAAVATVIGRGTGVAFQLYCLFRGGGRIVIARRHLRIVPEVLLRLARVSSTGILQFLIATASWLALVRILAIFGSATLAGYTIALRVILFALLPSWGLSNAAATLVGQNLGAKQPERAERSVWLTCLYNTIFLGTVGVVLFLIAEPLIGLFSPSAEVTAYGSVCLRWFASGYIFYGLGMVIIQAWNGAGDTVTPSIVNFFCYWLFQIPLAWVLAVVLGFGPTGVVAAVPISEGTLSVVAFLIFRRGRWKTRQI